MYKFSTLYKRTKIITRTISEQKLYMLFCSAFFFSKYFYLLARFTPSLVPTCSKEWKMERNVFSSSLEGLKLLKSEQGELQTKPFLDVCRQLLPILGLYFFFPHFFSYFGYLFYSIYSLLYIFWVCTFLCVLLVISIFLIWVKKWIKLL